MVLFSVIIEHLITFHQLMDCDVKEIKSKPHARTINQKRITCIPNERSDNN